MTMEEGILEPSSSGKMEVSWKLIKKKKQKLVKKANMKTIEERANEHEAEILDGCKDIEFEFIKALKEQREIDIDKACECFIDVINPIVMDDIKPNLLENNFKCIVNTDKEKLLNKFRVMMEGKTK